MKRRIRGHRKQQPNEKRIDKRGTVIKNTDGTYSVVQPGQQAPQRMSRKDRRKLERLRAKHPQPVTTASKIEPVSDEEWND